MLTHYLVEKYRSNWRSGDIFSKIRALDSNEPLTVDERLAREMQKVIMLRDAELLLTREELRRVLDKKAVNKGM
jgi:hypothetical protein